MANPKDEITTVSDTICCDDTICMNSALATGGKDSTHDRVCLAAEGFGNRNCFLQSMANNKELPFDMSTCVFALEQALSVRALQEMVSHRNKDKSGLSAGHRTLLYGHAVLLKHSHSNMYLSCLSTQSSSSDKLAFDVGLTTNTEGESCWWTIHPASKQRSEGEKVRVGDDLILVSVASERYLHIGADCQVIASFQQTLWTVQPVSSGVVRQKSMGFVFGSDVLRLFHGDECLTIPQRDTDSSQRVEEECESLVMYEAGAVTAHARSLWKVEYIRTKWTEACLGWGHTVRLKHMTSGKYLASTEDNQIITVHRDVATEDTTAFIVRQSKDDRKFSDSREDEGMGIAEIKYGDSFVFLQHMKTGLWLSYQTFETKKRGVGRVEEKKAILMLEGHMDDGLMLMRGQEEENKGAAVIRKCTSLINRFIKALESLKTEGKMNHLWENISMDEIVMTLEDLINYFAPPGNDIVFEERQRMLKALRNRQDLFQEEGMIALVLQMIDKCSQWKSMRRLAHLIGEESIEKWSDMINYLYLLLAALIQGNHSNCTQFASSKHIDWLVRRLEGQDSSKSVLDVLHSVLIDSPEALNVIKEKHIRTIISLIDKHGRHSKVLDVLCSLCVGNGVAVRSNQNLIMENLLPGRDLLLQTRVVDYVFSMSPNIFVGRCENSAMYHKWYYEAVIDLVETVTHLPTHVRIGWANTDGFVPYPGGGSHWGGNGVGDDFYSYSFDGVSLWTGGKPKMTRLTSNPLIKGDVIGVCLDLDLPQISYTLNGVPIRGCFKDFNTEGMFFPAISMSAKSSVRFMLGGNHGRLRFGPPDGHSPVCESMKPKEKLKIDSCFNLGNIPKGLICGPVKFIEDATFVPNPVETHHVPIPAYVENVTEKLAENLHELWAMSKIENGWIWGERRDDQRKIHPCIISYEKLSVTEKQYNISLAQETLRMLLALGYHITFDPQYTSNHRLKTQKLSVNYTQANGYRPAPLDLSGLALSEKLLELVEALAENTHNVWAKERIRQGWTYGLTEDFFNRRSHHLVPYSKVDEVIKKSNRQTASETVRTLMAYGYSLESPSTEVAETITKDTSEKKFSMRTYRAEMTYAVDSGKWYYEFEVITTGEMRVGWAKVGSRPGAGLGVDGTSYAFDGCTARKYNQGSEQYGKVWQKGDIIGCMLDMTDKTISFSLNGELMMDRAGQEIAFKGIDTNESYVPAISLSANQCARVNFGQDVFTLKFFTCCGLQEGYEPFCVNMTRTMPLWYDKEHAMFELIRKDHPRLEVVRVPGGSSSPPCLKIHSKAFGTLEKTCLEFIRLTLPVKFPESFLLPREKQLYYERRMMMEQHKMQPGTHGDEGDYTGDRRLFTKMGLRFGGESRGGYHGAKRGKSPFNLFKKNKLSRDPSPLGSHEYPHGSLPGMSASEYSMDSDDVESMAGFYPSPTTGAPHHPHAGGLPSTRIKKKRDSQASYASDALESESDYRELEMNMDVIDEYYYGVRILPGQDPMQVYVGWVTPQYRSHRHAFDMKSVRNVIITTMDLENQTNVSVSRKNCYMVSAGELYNRHGQQEDSSKKAGPGLLIGCMVDVSSGLLSFTVNGQEAANKFQVEPNSMLFPAVFFEPTNKEVLQVEFGRTKTALPLSSVLFRGGKHVQPQCPPRMDLQYLKTFQWSRCPISSNKVHVLKLSDVRGWSMLIEDPDQMMALHIPEEDRCVDILELKEHPHLLDFHRHTLDLYHALCFLGNHKAAHELTNYVNERQLMFCIKSKYMPGELRMGFHNILISIHLDSHATSRMMTQSEFIVPLAFYNREHSLFNVNWPHPPMSINYALSQEDQERQRKQQQQLENIRESIPSLEKSVSIRPSIMLNESATPATHGTMTPPQTALTHSSTVATNLTTALANANQPPPLLTSPHFPLNTLKRMMMDLLTEAVEKGGSHIRDPIGGSNANHFVPLIKVVDKLLIIGLLEDKDLSQLLYLIDPVNFEVKKMDDVQIKKDVITIKKSGLLQIKLSEPVKLELCTLLHHLCDIQLRHRIEALVAFTENFVGECQVEQRQRYIDIKQTDMPMAVAAKRTREFRCPPQEQMRSLFSFKNEEESESPLGDDLKEQLSEFHADLLRHANYNPPEEENEETPAALQIVDQESSKPLAERVLNYFMNKPQSETGTEDKLGPDNLQQLITSTVIGWATSDFIEDQALIRAMFSLLHRQYDGVYELLRSLEKTYVISSKSVNDVNKLNRSLGLVRSLLKVQVAPDEEEQLKTSIWDLADNRIFFQHPDLMRSLGIHETVMQLMINTLNKAQQESANTEVETPNQQISSAEPPKDTSAEMVVSCCRFLCYFCRTGRVNQKAMFEHLSYLLDNSCMLLSRPSLRGSCPLDVAYSSLMDNNELALALRESDLDKVAVYLSRCGQQSNSKLVANGYPDLGWDPVEGERFLDFLRFCVWVNGESVEENANLVVRLLIRRPECLGPALRGEGGGLLKAMQSSIIMSLQIAAAKNPNAVAFIKSVSESEDDDRGNYLYQNKYNFNTLPSEDDEDYIDMGAACLEFYSSLVDLLGRCAPEAEAIKAGRSDSLRARAILRSLVSLEDLEGALQIRFMLPVGRIQVANPDDEEGSGNLPTGLSPQHKTAIVLFLERVYGMQDQQTFFRLLENGFLPDLRAANMLEEAQAGDSEMALALNRYLFNAVLPLLTNYSHYFQEADNASNLLEQTLHIGYKMSKCSSLTNNQRNVVSDFLVALTSQLRPPMMTSLLRKLVIDVPALQENTITPLRVLVNHYERCGGYYGSGGWGMYGSATEEEKRLTMMLFSGIFDSLAKRGYDPELFSKALPCLSAIGCALSPDYSLGNPDDSFYKQCIAEAEWVYDPRPVDMSRVTVTEPLSRIIIEFAEHYHDSWAMNKIDSGWTFGNNFDEVTKQHPNLKSFQLLNNPDKMRYLLPIESSVKAMLAWGWSVEPDPTKSVNKSQIKKKQSKLSLGDYTPKPADLRGVTLTRGNLEMAEKLAELTHDVWALKKKSELESLGGALNPFYLPYSMLADKEKKENRERAQEMLRYMQMVGYRIINNEANLTRKDVNQRQKQAAESNGIDSTNNEKRFAYSLLEKLLEYVDKAAYNMRNMKPSSRFSRRHSFSMSSEDVKFFGKVVLPLVVRYFRAHKGYFISNNNPQQVSATIKEKEMTASLFSKLALLLRQRISAFGHDVQISVSCLQTIVQAIDARAIVKSSPEIVRSSILPFFTFAADDLAQIVSNLKSGRFSHVKGTITRGATSLNYVHMVLLPVLTSMFDHLGRHGFGADLLVGEEQLCCYKILNALYTLGTRSSTFVQRESIMLELARHRSALGECVASFASTFPVAFLEPQLNKFNKNSMVFGIEEENIATHSLEAKEVLDEVAVNVFPLDKIVLEIEGLAESGGKYNEAPHVIEVTLPMLCSYLPFWWSQGPDNSDASQVQVTTVTADQMNNVLGNVLKLVRNNIGTSNAPWMNKIASRTQPIIVKATAAMLKDQFLPVAVKIKEQAKTLDKEEEEYVSEMRKMSHKKDGAEIESDVPEKYQILVRDLYAFYPLLIKYVDLHRSSWLKTPNPDAEQLYLCIADVFNLSTKSHIFKKEEQNFVFSNEIDNMALIRPSQDKSSSTAGPQQDNKSEQMKPKSKKRVPKKLDSSASLNVACLKRLLPIGLNMFGGKEQELVQQAKQKFVDHFQNSDNSEGLHKDIEADTEEFLKISYNSEETMKDDQSQEWQNALYKRMSNKGEGGKQLSADAAVSRVLAMAKVLHGLHLIEHPSSDFETVWKKAVTLQRKRAVMACFRMVPLYNLSRHIAINLFLRSYKEQWLEAEPPGHTRLIEDITDSGAEEEGKEENSVVTATPQPLSQLITAFSRAATTESSSTLENDFLYISYASIMSQSCHGEEEEEEEGGGGGEEGEEEANPGASLQEQEMEKQKLLFEQSRLSDRGAAEMVLMYISASKGQWNDMVKATIDLGISILMGGNIAVQKRMLDDLKEKRDVGVFSSLAGLMQQCSVLDLDGFERYNKAEGLGVTGGGAQVKNLHDADNTIKLFRFLQLLCEGHNLDFQNYLRTQAGNTSIINIVICTVDYLLRLQESIMDFYWNYVSKDVIDESGKECFIRAISVASQVFNSISEYIQGPCQGNQLTLAHSRLWDAVGGFLFIFANMQDKLSRDPEQLDLLREFMRLQKDMMIMLLSMLEGNVMNGPIGRQMVDTLVESSQNFEMILKFFDIFLKMKDLTSSEGFMEIDVNGDGIITPKEFRKAMELQKIYTEEEIDYVMMCVDANQDGKVDFNEFTERFFDPAKDIGFNVAVLLTNLSEHIPNDPRLQRFLEKAQCVLNYFEPYLGRIEIMGGAERIERVYFEITQEHIDQWEKPQIKESKRAFLHNIVNEEGEKGKLECFVNFCEETIFEMQHANSISAEEQQLMLTQASSTKGSGEEEKFGLLDVVKFGFRGVKFIVETIFSCLSPSNIKEAYRTLRTTPLKDLIKNSALVIWRLIYFIFSFIFFVFATLFRFIWVMMKGEFFAPPPKQVPTNKKTYKKVMVSAKTLNDMLPKDSFSNQGPPDGFPEMAKESESAPVANGQASSDAPEGLEGLVKTGVKKDESKPKPTPEPTPEEIIDAAICGQELEKGKDEETSTGKSKETSSSGKGMNFWNFIVCLFARNFYTFKLIALALAFSINLFLLFFKVTKATTDLAEEDSGEGSGSADQDDESLEVVIMEENVAYLSPVLRIFALLHSFTALAMILGYYCLKVPLVVFKREKEVARSLEFDGMWIAEQPSEDDIKGHWDKLVISTQTFPDKYWDKFVKKKVRTKYSEQYEYEQISSLLGMTDSDSFSNKKSTDTSSSSSLLSCFVPSILASIDWQYQIWKFGIIITDNAFLYILFYFLFSLLGNFNYFFFAAHLLDVAVCFKTLGTILQSVTHNGKQLVLTVMLLSVVVYLYTVIAFNFFRKFYIQEEDDNVDYKCHDMLSCYVFHLYVGVRAGGGIGDEINPPDGDPYEVYRIFFDITFFFFVIVILLAIIQGLIIDAFGTLRDQLEQVKEDMESSCFICTIGKDYFDKMPHGFETHVQKEHNFANYMFFLMHLINKPDTEYTGQESYVWSLYQERCWDFFPVGECFRKQYEDELAK